MKFHENKFLTMVGAAALALAVGACSSNGDSDDSANGAGEEELRLLQEAFGEDDLTPEAITALRDQIMTLMARADLTPAEVQVLRDEITTLTGQITDLMAREDLTPEAVQALRDEITSLTAQVTALMATSPKEIQDLRDEIVTFTSQVMTLSARPDITAAEVQGLRTEISLLMLRANVSQTEYDALVAALGDMPLTVATLEMLVDDYNKNKPAYP